MFMSIASKIMRIAKDAATKLGENHPLILASSTAFFATFSIPPIIVILTNILSLYFKTESLSARFNSQISSVFGPKAADQLQSIATNFSAIGSEKWVAYAVLLFLVFIATNLFKVVRTSLNQIWNIRPKKKRKVLVKLKSRVVALGIILLTGILFLLSIFTDSVVSILKNYLKTQFDVVDVLLILTISKLLTLMFITLWFMSLFRYLTDARIHWKAISIGALITAFLFMIGKVALEKLLVNSNIGNVFETSASIVLVLLFIFYSSLIMYYGAALTFVLSKVFKKLIKPRRYAEKFEISTVVDL